MPNINITSHNSKLNLFPQAHVRTIVSKRIKTDFIKLNTSNYYLN